MPGPGVLFIDCVCGRRLVVSIANDLGHEPHLPKTTCPRCLRVWLIKLNAEQSGHWIVEMPSLLIKIAGPSDDDHADCS